MKSRFLYDEVSLELQLTIRGLIDDSQIPHGVFVLEAIVPPKEAMELLPLSGPVSPLRYPVAHFEADVYRDGDYEFRKWRFCYLAV